MKRHIFLALMLVLVMPLFAHPAAASHEASIQNFATSYGPGEPLEGTLNLSLADEPADISLNANFDSISRSILLRDFLNKSEVPYSCNPSDCNARYSKGNTDTTKVLPAGTSYLAFVIERGNNVEISSLSFDMTGNGGTESCGISPMGIDILDDGSADWEYDEPSDSLCYSLAAGETYDSGSASYDSILTDNPYCEKINLEKAGRFRLGVDIINGSDEKVGLSIIDTERNERADCEAMPENGMTSCDVNFTASEKKDYYVCAFSSAESNHRIRSEIESPTCGYGFSASEDFFAFQCNDTLTDYAVYASPMKIKAFGNTTNFSQDEFSQFRSEDLAGYLQDYIDSRYQGNCNQSCVIPMRLDLNQQVGLSNLNFKYSATGLGTSNQQRFYSSSKIQARMSANQTIMQLSDSGINVPSSIGAYSFLLTLGSDTVKSATITVEQVPLIDSITPLDAPALIPVKFSAIVTSPKNNSIVKYHWDFGDGSSDETEIPFANHSYGLGTFKLTLKAMDSEGLTSTKTFDIAARAPREYINATLAKKRSNINHISTLAAQIPKWYADIVNGRINLKKMSSDLSILESDFQSPDADYSAIKSSLDSFVTYASINSDEIGSGPVYPAIRADYLGYLGRLGEQFNESNAEEIANELKTWNSNVRMSADYAVKYAVADTSSENDIDLATVIRISLDSEKELQDVYFILILPQGVSANDTRINGKYDVQDLDGALGFTFGTLKNETIEIALPGKHLDLGMFASPSLANLVLPNVECGNGLCGSGEDYKNCPQDCKRPLWMPIFWSIVVWALVAGGIYWIWKYYAKRYDMRMQEKLFKEKADYVKLTSFIAEELNKAKNVKEIRNELGDAGWKSDQVEYAMKKVLKQTVEFQRQTVLNFIINEKNAGKVENEIREELKKAGWGQKTTDGAFKRFKKAQRRKRF